MIEEKPVKAIPMETPGYAGFLVDYWGYQDKIRLAGRLSDGSSFTAQISGYQPLWFFPDPQGDWSNFEGLSLLASSKKREGAWNSGLSSAEDFIQFTGIRGPILLHGTPRPGRRVDLYFDNPKIIPHTGNTELTWLSVDIETDRQGVITALSMVDTRGREVVYFWGNVTKNEKIRATSGEEELLLSFAQTLIEWDPDVITGWNVADFDLSVIARRFAAHGRFFDLGRAVGQPSGTRVSESGLTRVTLPGRQVVDAMRVARSSGRQFSDYRLETVAQEVLGRGKLIQQSGPEKLAALEQLRREDSEAFCLYCLQDARLVLDILKTTGLDFLTVSRASLTGMRLDLAWTSIPAFERIYALELISKKILPPQQNLATQVSGAAGGTVLDPIPGLFHQVMVFDFRSLYPSIMRTFNIDPLGYQGLLEGAEPLHGELENSTKAGPGSGLMNSGTPALNTNGVVRPLNPYHNSPQTESITAPNGARFSRRMGILPGLIDTYFKNREHAIKHNDETGAYVYKILMNSFYGVLGSPGCIYGRTELAGAITGFGRMCLIFARDFFSHLGYRVLYGDTDSVFVHVPRDGMQDLDRLGPRLAQVASRRLAREIESIYGLRSHIVLRFEKWYRRFLLPPLRSGGIDEPVRGRAKGYAGVHGEARTLEIKGMEAARSDYTELAKRFQRELLTLFFEDVTPKNIDSYVRKITASLLAGDLDDELIYHKMLRRPAQDYRGAAPPQVRAARLLGWTHQKGRISYLMTKAGPEPLGKISSPVDYRHYIDHQLRPIWQSLADAADIGETFLQPSMSETPLSPEYEVETGEPPLRGEQFSKLSPFDDQLELDF